jgi:hypothetical protein
LSLVLGLPPFKTQHRNFPRPTPSRFPKRKGICGNSSPRSMPQQASHSAVQ